jgi:hypothetical protein
MNNRLHAQVTLPPRKDRQYLLDRRLCGYKAVLNAAKNGKLSAQN